MNEKKGTEADAPKIPTEEVKVSTDDTEARIAAIEAEKAKLFEEKENYRFAYLKEKKKGDVDPSETEEERLRRIVREETASSRISLLDKEKEDLLKKTLRENKELKLAQLNKSDIPASTSVHSEGASVKDTLVTPEQERYFKDTLKWDDKKIANYKKNLQRHGR